MMHVTVDVFRFDELTERAKMRAIGECAPYASDSARLEDVSAELDAFLFFEDGRRFRRYYESDDKTL